MLCSEGDSDCERFDDDFNDLIPSSIQTICSSEDEWEEEIGAEFFRNPDFLAMEKQLLSSKEDLVKKVVSSYGMVIAQQEVIDQNVPVVSALLSDLVEKVCSTEIMGDTDGSFVKETATEGFLRNVSNKLDNEILFNAVDRFLQDVYDWDALDNLDTLNSMMSIHGYVFLKVSKLLFNRGILCAADQAANPTEALKKVPQVLRKAFVAISTEGDGSCFFDAVSLALFGSLDFSDVIRAGAIISARKHFPKVKQLMSNMGISSLKSLAIPVKVRKQNDLGFGESFNTSLCPILVSASINAPVVIISQFNRSMLNLLPNYPDAQDLQLREMISNGFKGIRMFAASNKMEHFEHLTLLFENGDHYTCLAKNEMESDYIPPYAFSAATTLY